MLYICRMKTSKSVKDYEKLFEKWQNWPKFKIEELTRLKKEALKLTLSLEIRTDRDALTQSEEIRVRKRLKTVVEEYRKLLKTENPHWIPFRNAFKTQLEASGRIISPKVVVGHGKMKIKP